MNAGIAHHDNLMRLVQLLASQNHSHPWLREFRQQAGSLFNQKGLPLPVRNHENWRFTDVSPLTRIEFSLPEIPADTDLSALLDPRILPSENATQLIFFNGKLITAYLSTEAEANEVTAQSLFSPDVVGNLQVRSQFGTHAKINRDTFIALNAALATDGAYLHIPDNTELADPIHLIYLHGDAFKAFVTSPRNLIWVGKNSQVNIVEKYIGIGTQAYLSNAVTEINALPHSRINHCKLQEENASSFHIAHTHAQLADHCAYVNTHITLSGKLARNNVRVFLGGERSTCILNGVYLGKDQQLVDNHTWIDHAKPHCESHELYKGILTDKANGVFNGKIFVHPHAQKTDAKQTNRALLLSDDAKINTKPELEIYADDVKCTHGATVGHLDDEALFYLQARGIDRQSANSMLTIAFAAEALEQVANQEIIAKTNEHIARLFG